MKADQRMCTNAVRQPVMNGCDFDVGLQNAETALDIVQRLVVCDGFGGGEIGCVGQQRQLSVEEFGTHDGLFIKVPAKTVRLQVRLDEPAQFRFGDGPGKSAIGPAIGGAPSTSGLPFALSVEATIFSAKPSNSLIRVRRLSACSFARTGSCATIT